MTRFHVLNSFAIENKKQFVIYGSVMEGQVRAGMFIKIPFNSQISLTAKIHSIEFTKHQEREDISLCIKYSDSAELALWRGLDLSDETIDITEEGNK